jgi:hypothetical protein
MPGKITAPEMFPRAKNYLHRIRSYIRPAQR